MLIKKLRHKIIPLYLAVFATLLPALIQVAQALPVGAPVSGSKAGFVIICTGQGVISVPSGDEPEQPRSGGSIDCAICLSLLIANHTLAPTTFALTSMRQTGNSILVKHNATTFSNDISLRYLTRAPPFKFIF